MAKQTTQTAHKASAPPPEKWKPVDEQFKLLVESVSDHSIFLIDDAGRIQCWNSGAERMNGYRADEIIGQHFSILYPPEDRETGKPESELRRAVAEGKTEDEGWRIRKDGGQFWANVVTTTLRYANDELHSFAVVTRDMAEQRRRMTLLESQRQVLALVIDQAPLSEILDTLVRLVEEQVDGMFCAVLIADAEQQRLHIASAPKIPRDFIDRTNEFLSIGPKSGTCGTAAFFRTPIYIRDVSSEPLPEKFREMALSNGFHAIWSTPVLSKNGDLLGVFAMYYREPQLPSSEHRQLIDMATQVMRVAIQARQVAGRLRVKENLLHLISENASDLIALIDVSGRYLYRSTSRMKLGGDQTSINAVDYVHPEDRSRFREALEKVVDTGINQRVEIRLAISGREVRYLQSELGPVRGPAGTVNAVVVVGRDVTDQRRIQKTLHEREESLQALSRRLVELQEFERRQLSRELHDRIGQNLTALNINLDILKTRLSGDGTKELRSRLEDSAALLESTVDAIENVMSELRPPMLDDYGLLPALQWYAKGFSARTGINVAVRGDELAERPLPEIEITLFRIAQEALNNVVKHAGATSVEIAFERLNSGCEMSVSDNGTGFDASPDTQATSKSGLGMITMRERAQAVGGRFEVRSARDRGTQVTVRIPC